MPSSLQGNLECKSNCKYVLHLEEKLQKTEIHYSNKCREFDSLKYKNSELRAKNTALREEFNMLLAKLRKEEKNAEKAAEFKSRAEELERRNRELEAELSKCNKEAGNVEALKKELDEANSKIRKYEVRLNMDSRNSSKPTSTNAPERKVIQNNRKKTGKRPGGQPGHKGHRRVIPDSAKVIYEDVILEPDQKIIDEGIRYTGREKHRTVTDCELVIKCKRYISKEYIDSTGKRCWTPFPEEVSHNEASYGPKLKSLIYYLLNRCNVSICNVKEFLKEFSDDVLSPSAGFIQNLMREFKLKSAEEADAIAKKLDKSPYMHVDFTNATLNGKYKQVLVCSNGNDILYLYRDHKGHSGIKGSPIEAYMGILIHDHDVTFYGYGEAHQECIVHILRYLIEVTQQEKNLTWAQKMFDFYIKAIALKKEEIEKLTPDEIRSYKEELLAILDVADKEYAENPPKEYFRKGYCLSKRLREYVDSELRFLTNPELPHENNCAERFARKVKRKLHTMTTFRSEESAKQICHGLSIIHSTSAKGENVMNKITEIFSRPLPPPVKKTDEQESKPDDVEQKNESSPPSDSPAA